MAPTTPTRAFSIGTGSSPEMIEFFDGSEIEPPEIVGARRDPAFRCRTGFPTLTLQRKSLTLAL